MRMDRKQIEKPGIFLVILINRMDPQPIFGLDVRTDDTTSSPKGY